MSQRVQRLILCFTATLCILIILSLCVGRYPIQFSDFKIIMDFHQETTLQQVFFQLRLPRTLMVILSGFALAQVGSILQTVFKNPLAAPEIIGVSSGASVGAVFGIVFLGGSFQCTMMSAFVGGILAVCLSMGLAMKSRNRQLASFVLSGIAVNAVAQSLLMLMKLVADPTQQLASIEFWMMGGFNTITQNKLFLAFPFIAFSILSLLVLSKNIQMLSLNDDESTALGVNVKVIRPLILILCTLSVSAVVSICGLISFIGLIAPHIARMLAKRNHPSVWILSGFIGANLLLLADCIAKTIGQSEIPISIITSLIGAPFLIYLMMKSEKIV